MLNCLKLTWMKRLKQAEMVKVGIKNHDRSRSNWCVCMSYQELVD